VLFSDSICSRECRQQRALNFRTERKQSYTIRKRLKAAAATQQGQQQHRKDGAGATNEENGLISGRRGDGSPLTLQPLACLKASVRHRPIGAAVVAPELKAGQGPGARAYGTQEKTLFEVRLFSSAGRRSKSTQAGPPRAGR